MAIKTSFKHRFWKNDGTVNAGGKVWTYVAGTTTPVSTYTTSIGDVANTNPIILDSKGEAEIWTNGIIKVNVLESDDTQVTGWPVDNVGAGVTNDDANARWAGTATGTANALVITPSPAITAYAIGQSFIFKAGASPNSAATTIAISGLTAIAVQSNGAACSGGEILATNFYVGVLDTLTTCQISKIGEPTLAELGAASLGVTAGKAVQVDQTITATTRAGTTTLSTSLNHTLSDTSTTVTAFNGVAGVTYHVRALGAGNITHHATDLIVTQGGASITTAAGDTFDIEMITGTTCRLKNLIRATGTFAASGANADITSMSAITAITTTGGLDIKGTNTNDAAAADYVGEYATVSVTSGSDVSLTTATPTNITSISLAAGDWDVTGTLGLRGGATTTVGVCAFCFSQTSNSIDSSNGSYVNTYYHNVAIFNNGQFHHVAPTLRVSLASTTTIYLVANITFGTSTCNGFGMIRARRTR